MKNFLLKGRTMFSKDIAGGYSSGGLATKSNQKLTINIAVLGDPKSGKSSLIEAFLFGQITERFKDTVINIYQSNITEKKLKIDLNYFEISGNYERDKDAVGDYLRMADVVIICTSFEEDFKEENITHWLETVEANSINSKSIYLVNTKYDIKVMMDYQKGANTTTLMFANGNLHTFGERIKTFINTNSIKEYYITSSLLNFNVKELFHSIIKDFVYESLCNSAKLDFKDQNCVIF
jgi:small GTP-binding protein